MSKGETMKPQPTRWRCGYHDRYYGRVPSHCRRAKEGGEHQHKSCGVESALPGADWFRFGGVAIQADPCLDEDCWDGVLGPDCNAPCPKCHGLGVIPQHGSIQRLPVHWSKTNEDGSFSGGFAEKRCVVVPIGGDE